jgi:flavin-dependent dehydrogenase
MDEKSANLQFEWIEFHKKNEIYVGLIECNQAGFGWWYFPNQNGFFHVLFINILQN